MDVAVKEMLVHFQSTSQLKDQHIPYTVNNADYFYLLLGNASGCFNQPIFAMETHRVF
jgi:hypothetical protein